MKIWQIGIEMASPGEMVKKVAETLGESEATVFLHDRNLSEAGLRTKGGRGRNAAQMTVKDISSLLIAVAASHSVKDSVDTVKKFSSLPSQESLNWNLQGLDIPSLKNLPEGHTFNQALEGLLTFAASDELNKILDDTPKLTGTNQIIPWYIEVTFFSPNPQAQIRINISGQYQDRIYSALTEEMNSLEDLIAWGAPYSGDLKKTSRISQVTLLSLGELLEKND